MDKLQVDHVFCDNCPAPWATTPDSDCLICEYIRAIIIKSGRAYVKCGFTEMKKLYWPHED